MKDSTDFFSLKMYSLTLCSQANMMMAPLLIAFWKHLQEEKEHEAYLKRRAIAAKWEAEKAAKELQVQREQDLQWFQSSLDTTKAVGGFLFELWVKALPLSSPQAAKESRHRRHSKAEDKNSARFL